MISDLLNALREFTPGMDKFTIALGATVGAILPLADMNEAMKFLIGAATLTLLVLRIIWSWKHRNRESNSGDDQG